MVVVVPTPPTLSPETIDVYYVIDELLARSPILIFYGPSATPTATLSNSRIQAHVFSPAGFQSYPRLTVAPSSQLYTTVTCLPREEQGDEVSRGLAFSLYKYFAELPRTVKDAWENLPSALGRLRSSPALFSDAHAAMLASKMVKVENNAEVIQDVRQALAEQSVPWLDIDLILPSGSMRKIDMNSRDSIIPDPSEDDILNARYGQYASLIKLFGESSFLPTSRLKRAPSKATLNNTSSTFKREQKENIRREMCELLDTEESYVSKLNDLVYKVAADFRQKAKRKDMFSTSPSLESLKSLFPPSLDDMLVVNSAFLDALRQVVEETEEQAIRDMETTPDEGTAVSSVPTRTDVTGTLSLAMILRSWFPKFSQSYVDYIKAHTKFSTYLKAFAKDAGSSFSKRLADTGEQKLMSMLIEPVQRLPRYQLYIDSIVKQLPARHPALKSLLKARDTITEICAENVSNTSPSQIMEQLRTMIPSWPASLQVQGRLVTAVDIIELQAPYRVEKESNTAVKGVLILFTDFIVVLKKNSPQSTTARGLMAQLDGIDVISDNNHLTFRQALELQTFNITEMDEGRALHLMPITRLAGPDAIAPGSGSSRPGSGSRQDLVQVFRLAGTYEGKASRFLEELVKARVEGRFSEKEREGHAWEVRASSGPDLTLLTAIFEEPGKKTSHSRGVPAPVQVCVEPGETLTNNGKSEITVGINRVQDGLIRLRMEGACNLSTLDTLTANEFVPVFMKRIHNALQIQSQIRNPAISTTLLLRNQHILQALHINLDEQPRETLKVPIVAPAAPASRPHSPVKLLTNLFGGSISRDNSSLRKHNTSANTSLVDVPRLTPASAPNSRPTSQDANKSLLSLAPSYRSTIDESKLEETYASYILALEARQGNIVGKIVRNRATADELMVNEVYNSLLDDPSNHEIAAQAPIDVLFAAFEKFVNVAWHNGVGPLISQQSDDLLQAYLQSGQDFAGTMESMLQGMDDATKTAFCTTIKLLSNLLDATTNDGDKGILTAVFAEVMISEGEVFQFVPILDRLVEDPGLLEVMPDTSIVATPHGSTASRHSAYQGTTNIASHSSSLRKKLGFGSLSRKAVRQQSEESEGPSVWRTLSKSKLTHGGQPSLAVPTLQRAPISRSQSTDTDPRATPKRPVSRDNKSGMHGSFTFEQQAQLSTIGEHPLLPTSPPPRKKRRSSISDLRSLHASANNSPAPLNNIAPPRNAASPRTPSAARPSMIPAPSPLSARLQTGSLRGTSPYSKAEITPSSRTLPRPLSSARASILPTAKFAEPLGTTSTTTTTPVASRRRKENTPFANPTSNIPTLRPASGTIGPGLSERPTSGNVRRLPPPPSAEKDKSSKENVPAKLRMQSPKKLRERLANERRAIDEADSALQAEINRIGEELSRGTGDLDSSNPASTSATKPTTTTNPTRPRNHLSPSPSQPPSTQAIQQTLSTLSTSHTTLLTHLRARLDTLSTDISTTLSASESRAAKLDTLYKEANAENEALYSKFNEELARVVRGVRMEGGREAEIEVGRILREREVEMEGLRRENARLRREVVGLRGEVGR